MDIAKAWANRPALMKKIGWRSLLILGIAASLIWLEEDYYFFSSLIALHPGVSSSRVKEILGTPYIDGGESLLYQKKGVGTMLWIHFAGPNGDGEICDWFVLSGPWPKDRDEYKVKRYTFYRPGGLLPGPADIDSIEVPIFRVDVNGNPYPGTAPR